MAPTSKAGIQTGADGTSFIPSSKRSDGTTRKEIRIRPGYRPPEDVETYKNRSAEAWKNRGQGGVPGADIDTKPAEDEAKSKNAKRRGAARRKAANEDPNLELTTAMKGATLIAEDKAIASWSNPDNLVTNESQAEIEAEKQKKIRNVLKKLTAVRELKSKKAAGEKLSTDQLVKMSKEEELVRDLQKLGYDEKATVATSENENGQDMAAG